MKIEANISVNYTLQLIDSNPEWISRTLISANVKESFVYLFAL